VNYQNHDFSAFVLGIKIMMPPEVVDSVAGALIAKQVLRQIARTAVRTPYDGHYFAVMMHKGLSSDIRSLSFNDLAKVLSCPTATVHTYIAEHMIYGSARGGCKICNAASPELQSLIVEEKDKGRSDRDLLSVFITMDSVRSLRKR
jgi:hypothetical protein